MNSIFPDQFDMAELKSTVLVGASINNQYY